MYYYRGFWAHEALESAQQRKGTRQRMKRIIALIACFGALALGTGIAQASSTSCSYGICNVASQQQSRTTATAAASSSLPFTGLDVGLLAVGGAGLLGAGMLVRRLSNTES
jgi:hypothetical protein